MSQPAFRLRVLAVQSNMFCGGWVVEMHPPNTLEIDGEYFAMEGQPLEAYFAMSDIPPILSPDGEG